MMLPSQSLPLFLPLSCSPFRSFWPWQLHQHPGILPPLWGSGVLETCIMARTQGPEACGADPPSPGARGLCPYLAWLSSSPTCSYSCSFQDLPKAT